MRTTNKPAFVITKKVDGVSIKLTNQAYEHLCKEVRLIADFFAKRGATLEDAADYIPMSLVLLSTQSLIQDMQTNEKIIDQ